MLEAFLRAEQFDKAEALLSQRLKRRESPRDMFWLGRARESNGDHDGAGASIEAAQKGWQGADPGTQEMAALTRLAANVG